MNWSAGDLAENTSPWMPATGDPRVPITLCCPWKKPYLVGNAHISVCSGLELEEVALLGVYHGRSALWLLRSPLPFPKCASDSPWLEQPEVQLLLQTVINVLLPPRIISTSRSKNFMLESSPAHCSTPGDAGKDLRKEGLAESTSQAAYLGKALFSLPPLFCSSWMHLPWSILAQKVFKETLLQGWFASVNIRQRVVSSMQYRN